MTFASEPVTTAYQAANAGVSLLDTARCEHDHPAFTIAFIGRWVSKTTTADLPDPLNVVLARCSASHVVGAFLAFLAATEGTDAADAFMDEIRTTAEELTPLIRHLETPGQGCCEAACRTGGREHTCKGGAQQ